MSNSNGMYNVLNIFKKLEPVEQPTAKQQAQAIYESVEARGSILEGVGRVEKKLAEQFASFKEGEKVPTKGGMVHKGTYGNSYNDDEPAASDGPRKRGRPAKGTPKKAAPTGEKRGRGRPKKDTSTELKTKGGDIFGRTTGAVPKGKKGTVIKGKGNIDEKAVNPYAVGMAQAMKSTGDKPPLQKSTITKAHDIAKKVKTNESRIMEGFNFAEMAKDTDMSVSEMLETIQNDIRVFKETGTCSDTLEAFLKIHNHGKKQLQDATIPRGPSFAPQHADIPPVQKPGMLDRVKGAVKTGLEKLGHPDDAGMRADLQKKMGIGEELDELARLAGISETKDKKADKDYDGDGKIETGKDEYLGSKIAAAKKAGKLEEGQCPKCNCDPCKCDDVEEGNAFTGKLAKTKKGDSFELDGKKFKDTSSLDESLDECMSPIGSAAQGMEQQEGRINVSTNMSSDGNKSVNISADGNAADQLMQMLKMAGMGGEQAEKHVQLMIAKPEGGEEMEEATGQYANTPEEEYAGVDTIIDQGEDMNRQKKQFADKPRQGDNPMATQPMAEEIDPIGTLGRDLMKEYQALKLAK